MMIKGMARMISRITTKRGRKKISNKARTPLDLRLKGLLDLSPGKKMPLGFMMYAGRRKRFLYSGRSRDQDW
jgi:hypothetical protein